jgi:Putative peptidoglycan binding domain
MIMRFHLVPAVALLWPALLYGQPSTGKATTPVKTRVATTKTKSTAPAGRIPVHTSSTRQSTTTSKGATPTRQVASRPYVPPRPSAPSSDRYREIQESLISKGYMQGPASGVWDQNSTEAMRKFQTEQKMEPTGKISAKALITLGLGPKDETVPPTASK